MENSFIKELTEADYEAFHDLYSQVLFEAFPEFSQNVKTFLTSREQTKERFANFLKFGAFVSGEMVGYILAHKPEGGVTKIDWLGIKKAYEHQGIGTALIKRAEEETKKLGVHNIQFVCDAHLVEFYISKGYEVLGFDKQSYFGYDVYVMKKLLQEPDEKKFLR